MKTILGTILVLSLAQAWQVQNSKIELSIVKTTKSTNAFLKGCTETWNTKYQIHPVLCLQCTCTSCKIVSLSYNCSDTSIWWKFYFNFHFLVFPNYFVHQFETGKMSMMNSIHTILKVKFLSKNFTSFLPKFFLTIFLVKSKLSTAKKSKTTTFSRVFHPNFFWQFFSWNQSCQQLKSPKQQHFREFFTPKNWQLFSGNQSWIFGQKMKISNSV